MTAFAILRTAKLKSATQIIGAVGHNARRRETQNANPNRKNVMFVDIGTDPAAAVMNRIKTAGAVPRADSVLAVEVLCSASPEYFRPGQEAEAGIWDADRTKKWAQATQGWLQRRFGDRLLDSRLHLDESTPHIQAVVVPLTRDNRLSAKEVIGPLALKQMQTGYAKALEHLGIARGLEGSQAKHTTIKEYYRDVNSPVRLPPDLVPEPIPAPPLLLTAAARDEWAEAQNKKAMEAARHQAQQRAPALKQLVRKARERDVATKRTREARVEDARLEQIHRRRVTEMQQQAQRLTVERDVARVEADRLRGVKLEAVLDAAGLDRGEDGRWSALGHDIKVVDGKWFDDGAVTPVSGKGAIDLVKHLEGCDYQQAIGWLREHCGGAAAEAAVVETKREAARREVEAAPVPKFFEPPPPTSENHPGWPVVKRWLVQVRGLKEALVERLRGLGMVRVETRKPTARSMSELAMERGRGQSAGDMYNAVFMTQRLDRSGIEWIGGEVRGVGQKFAGLLPGSNRKEGGFRLVMGGEAEPDRVVLVESALDAIAYAELRPREPALIVSTGGVTGKHSMMKAWKLDGRTLAVAFDNDYAGNSAAARLIEHWNSLPGGGIVERLSPVEKDWNDDLRARTLPQPRYGLPNLPVAESRVSSRLLIGPTEPVM